MFITIKVKIDFNDTYNFYNRYTGHCPEYKYRIGDTYGSTTHKILLDPSVQHSERLVLSDRTADDYQAWIT